MKHRTITTLIALAAALPVARSFLALEHAPQVSIESTVDEERTANRAAFHDGYLSRKELLFEQHAGQWLVIVDGNIVPTLDGRVAPTSDLAVALAAADALAPDAQHRFVFRIGEEGEIRYHSSGSQELNMVGLQIVGCFDGDLVVDSNGIHLEQSSAGSTASKRIGSGLSDSRGPHLSMRLRSPDGANEERREMQFASGFTGYALVSMQLANELGLARFEIPGGIDLGQGGNPLRRARAHFFQEESGLDVLLPVGICGI